MNLRPKFEEAQVILDLHLDELSTLITDAQDRASNAETMAKTEAECSTKRFWDLEAQTVREHYMASHRPACR